MRRPAKLRTRTKGSALLEFAIVLPLLVVFIVGIYDFSGAYNQKLKLEQSASAGASAAAGQPTGDMDSPNPDSLQPVVNVIFNSLAADGVLPLANQGTCVVPVSPAPPVGVSWTYTITGCSAASSDDLTITINRGVIGPVVLGTPTTVSTAVTVSFPYHWRFNSVIQLVGGGSFAAVTNLQETATVHNQM